MTPWTVAHQAPLSMEFSRQEYWSGLPFPSPGDLPDLGFEARSAALQILYYLSHQGSSAKNKITDNVTRATSFLCPGLIQGSLHNRTYLLEFAGGSVVKNLPANAGDLRCRLDPWVGKIPWRRKWQPIPMFLSGESHGQRSLEGYSP